MTEDWKFVPPEAMTLGAYRCGVQAGGRLRLGRGLPIRDHRGRPSGRVHRAGEIWTVLTGNPDEPDVVWLRQPDGGQHTWDDTVLEWFEQLPDEG